MEETTKLIVISLDMVFSGHRVRALEPDKHGNFNTFAFLESVSSGYSA